MNCLTEKDISLPPCPPPRTTSPRCPRGSGAPGDTADAIAVYKPPELLYGCEMMYKIP